MEEVAVECTHCHVEMTSRSAGGGTMRYYNCPRCKRTYASFYDEVFKMGAGARVKAKQAETPEPEEAPVASAELESDAAKDPEPKGPVPYPHWSAVKARAEAWFERLDREAGPGPRAAKQKRSTGDDAVMVADEDPFDPWSVLGVEADAAIEVIRAAYRRAALRCHPDRGGDPAEMVLINRAYQAIRAAAEPVVSRAIELARVPT